MSPNSSTIVYFDGVLFTTVMKKIWLLLVFTPLTLFARSKQKFQTSEKWADNVYN